MAKELEITPEMQSIYEIVNEDSWFMLHHAASLSIAFVRWWSMHYPLVELGEMEDLDELDEYITRTAFALQGWNAGVQYQLTTNHSNTLNKVETNGNRR